MPVDVLLRSIEGQEMSGYIYCKQTTKLYGSLCGNIPIKDTDYCWMHTPGYQRPLEKCQQRNEKLIAALQRIDTWAKAYPLDVFERPDLKKAHKILKAADMTLDAISADAMRHVLDGLKDIVSDALKK